ncbi:hypothetical protein [Cellulosimicrobium cellulans]|uniref:hypothetical protein n=1 Tax=Cellulosimicrobium cellulans TaxID=1710 RepID=UPI0024071995|nr:hypothetical protein [Cellulosimicrobium cellulans]MDF9875806.1 hypothetical protein [Cellulosimicrobium cellulans]
MNDLSSPRLHVLIDGTATPARVLAELKQVSALGFTELRALVASGAPVLDVETFTHDWYDGGASRILDLLAGWEADGIAYVLQGTSTAPGGDDGGEASRITLDELRNIIRSSEGDRARMEELDASRYGGAS